MTDPCRRRMTIFSVTDTAEDTDPLEGLSDEEKQKFFAEKATIVEGQVSEILKLVDQFTGEDIETKNLEKKLKIFLCQAEALQKLKIKDDKAQTEFYKITWSIHQKF